MTKEILYEVYGRRIEAFDENISLFLRRGGVTTHLGDLESCSERKNKKW
jgi:hypothetical protein